MSPTALLFTDLDGTLLDHETYSFDAARPAIHAVQARQLPIILTTSKTLPEVRDINRALHNLAPVIVENGGAMGFPLALSYPFELTAHDELDEFAIVRFSPRYVEIRQFIEQQRDNHGFQLQGFGDMTAGQVARHTGLAHDEAVQARERLCSEPFIWEDSELNLQRFRRAAAEIGLRVTQGGRFHHLMGNTSKAEAMLAMRNLFTPNDAPAPLTIALGDSENDQEMLQHADVAVVVMRHDGSHLDCNGIRKTIKTSDPGPTGWNAAVEQLLDQLDDLTAIPQGES